MARMVSTDEMLDWFEALQVGEEYGSQETRFTEAEVREHADWLDDRSPWYHGESPFGGTVVHPTRFYYAAGALRRSMYELAGPVLTKLAFEYRKPVRPGELLQISSRVVDKYIKRGRYYYVVESTFRDEQGKEAACCKETVMLSMPHDPEKN